MRSLIGIILVVWLVIGARRRVPARLLRQQPRRQLQDHRRHRPDHRSPGPLNYLGANPKIDCNVPRSPRSDDRHLLRSPVIRYTKLGSTGLDVSAVTLGCMSWGDPARGGHPWVARRGGRPRPSSAHALEAGINVFDTANVYSGGSSEEITGRALRDFARREEVVLATKVHGRMRPGPNGAGLSRKAILHEIDASCTRLGTDYVDLYQIHRWDPHTPIEETMEALHDVVRAGKARYLGASSMYAWQFAKAQHVAERHGWTPFVSMQNHYNLLYREEEREMLPLCADQGVGVIPWSPLARGRLTRDWDAQHRPRRDRRVRRDALPRRGPGGRRDRRPGRRAARRLAGPGRAGLADGPARRHLPDRRRDQSRSTSRTRSPPSTSSWTTRSSRSWAPATCRTPSPGTGERPRPAADARRPARAGGGARGAAAALALPLRWPLPFSVEDFLVREGQEAAWVAVHEGRVVGHVAVGRPRPAEEEDFASAAGTDALASWRCSSWTAGSAASGSAAPCWTPRWPGRAGATCCRCWTSCRRTGPRGVLPRPRLAPGRHPAPRLAARPAPAAAGHGPARPGRSALEEALLGQPLARPRRPARGP